MTTTATARRDLRKQKKEEKSFFAELPGLLLAALTVAVIIKTFIVQPFYIPSRSMVPTLLVNDRVMVSKMSNWLGETEPGDIIVFVDPSAGPVEESAAETVVRSILEALGIRGDGPDDLIKRVIAVEGQTVEIKSNQVLVDGVAIDEPYLPEGVYMSDMEARTLAAGELWMMGDNRNESSDSRVFGPISEESVVGEALLRIWPLDRVGGL